MEYNVGDVMSVLMVVVVEQLAGRGRDSETLSFAKKTRENPENCVYSLASLCIACGQPICARRRRCNKEDRRADGGAFVRACVRGRVTREGAAAMVNAVLPSCCLGGRGLPTTHPHAVTNVRLGGVMYAWG